MALNGKTLGEIAATLGTDHETFWRWKERDPKFSQEFGRARSEGLELIADTLLTMVDDVPDVNKARLKSDNIKWLLSKRKAHTYGDRLDVNVNHTVDIGGALAEARSRALPQSDLSTHGVIDVVDIPQLNASCTTDSKSDSVTESGVSAPSDPSLDIFD